MPSFVLLSEVHVSPSILSVVEAVERMSDLRGKEVCVRGVLSWRFETKALWDTAPDMRALNLDKSIWVDLPDSAEVGGVNPQSLHGAEVVITGYLDANRHGHMGMFKGTIGRITQLGKQLT
jgi:hypothetical protein